MAKSPFFDGVSEFNIGFINASESTMRAVTIKTWDGIIKGSPVDEGRFRGNWFATGKSPSTRQDGSEDKTGDKTSAMAAKRVIGQKDWSMFTLTNNMPQAQLLEFGGYPKSVSKGTYDKKTKSYEIRTTNGFSKQAPNGMVRINMARVKRLLEEEAAKRFKKL